MIYAQGKGQNTYRTVYKAAEERDQIGIHKHMRSPTNPTSRLGFTGRKVSNKAKRELAAKLLKAAETKPELQLAALNMTRFL